MLFCSDRVHLKYTPAPEALSVYMWADENKEILCGSSNKNEQRIFDECLKSNPDSPTVTTHKRIHGSGG